MFDNNSGRNDDITSSRNARVLHFGTEIGDVSSCKPLGMEPHEITSRNANDDVGNLFLSDPKDLARWAP
jgi:hypothetical protein